MARFASLACLTSVSSEGLAEEWRPYVSSSIDAFTPARAMVESNFPVDEITCRYRVLWNAFKQLAAHCSDTERHDLFFGTVQRCYRLDVDAA